MRSPQLRTISCRGCAATRACSAFWTSPRSVDTNNRERQLLVDFISASSGGPTFYLGRDMKTSHKGMGIDQVDYTALKRHLAATLEKFNVPERERDDVMPSSRASKTTSSRSSPRPTQRGGSGMLPAEFRATRSGRLDQAGQKR
jgi:truncated hemoglobin YjbI